MRSAPRARAKSRHALKAYRLAWISVKTASRTLSSALTDIAHAGAGFD